MSVAELKQFMVMNAFYHNPNERTTEKNKLVKRLIAALPICAQRGWAAISDYSTAVSLGRFKRSCLVVSVWRTLPKLIEQRWAWWIYLSQWFLTSYITVQRHPEIIARSFYTISYIIKSLRKITSDTAKSLLRCSPSLTICSSNWLKIGAIASSHNSPTGAARGKSFHNNRLFDFIPSLRLELLRICQTFLAYLQQLVFLLSLSPPRINSAMVKVRRSQYRVGRLIHAAQS